MDKFASGIMRLVTFLAPAAKAVQEVWAHLGLARRRCNVGPVAFVSHFAMTSQEEGAHINFLTCGWIQHGLRFALERRTPGWGDALLHQVRPDVCLGSIYLPVKALKGQHGQFWVCRMRVHAAKRTGLLPDGIDPLATGTNDGTLVPPGDVARLDCNLVLFLLNQHFQVGFDYLLSLINLLPSAPEGYDG